jgi:hypothetical protein
MNKLGILLVVILALLGTGYFIAHRGLNEPDDVLIRELIRRGEVSVQTQDARQAMSCISPNYKSKMGGNYDGLRLFIVQAFSADTRYDLQVEAPKINVDGDQAVALTKIDLNGINGANNERIFSGPITLILQKEPSKRLWIFTVKEWKVISAEGFTPMQEEMGM